MKEICGDSKMRGVEECDDGNTISNDGCDGVNCKNETGFNCTLTLPTVCNPILGDFKTVGTE